MIEEITRQYGMSTHPEGGYYRETYRSQEKTDTAGLPAFPQGGIRSAMTSILFLIPGNTFSSLHRIRGREIWNFHSGDAAVIFEICGGKWKETELGTGKGQVLQHVVEPGTWFGSRCINENGYSLCGCTVVPGFDFEDFELAGKKELVNRYPDLAAQIHLYTRLP